MYSENLTIIFPDIFILSQENLNDTGICYLYVGVFAMHLDAKL